MKRLAIVATVFAAMTAAPAAADTYVRQPGIRIAHYTFDITLRDANNEFAVRETVDVRIVTAGASSSIRTRG